MFKTTQITTPRGADDQDWSELLDEVIKDAEARASADALAVLRVCSVLASDSARAAASEAAGRLAAAGVPDRSWASLVGHPQLLRAWRYHDVFGEQESVGALFDYNGGGHAMMVLIDHSPGGGVQDGWLAAGRRARDLRNRMASEMATHPEAILEDVAASLHLIRSRVDHLLAHRG